MAAPRSGKPYSAALLAQTRQVWQGPYGRPLSEEDASAITGNMVDFLEVLMEWEEKNSASHS